MSSKAQNNVRNRIKNYADLMLEIERIEAVQQDSKKFLMGQAELVKDKIQAPIRFYNRFFGSENFSSKMMNFALGSVSRASKRKGYDQDWLTTILRIATPFLLKNTVLRNAGWVKKLFVLLGSEAVVSRVSKSSISNGISNIANFFRPKSKKKSKVNNTPVIRKVTITE